MIQSLRRRLTLLFLALFILIYGLGGAAALAVFYSGLTTALDEEIADLSSEVMPAIKLIDGIPSLKSWAAQAVKENLTFPAGIQLYDRNKKLIESYGLSGNDLFMGEFPIVSKGQNTSLRSNYEQILMDGKIYGYLQIQINTDPRNDAVRAFGLTMLMMLPFLALTVTLAGNYFAGQAIEPVEKSLSVLTTFVADAGHEFTTPVTVVEASIQTLEEILKEHNIDLDVLNIMTRASNTMKELASDLLFLAKMENPGFDLPKEILNLNEIIEPVMEEFLEIARSKSVLLNCTAIPDLRVQGNAQALKILFSNLISNALKYTESGGKVEVSVTQEGNKVCVNIEDTGIGIPPESIDRIFERFYRVDKSRTRSAGGSGLGLAIVKAILELHESDIEVQSSPGEGSKFSVRLPKYA